MLPESCRISMTLMQGNVNARYHNGCRAAGAGKDGAEARGGPYAESPLKQSASERSEHQVWSPYPMGLLITLYRVSEPRGTVSQPGRAARRSQLVASGGTLTTECLRSRVRFLSRCPLQVERQKAQQHVLVGEVVGPAVGIQHGVVEPLVGVDEPGGAPVVQVGESQLLQMRLGGPSG